MKTSDGASRKKQESSKRLLFESMKKKTSYLLNKPVLEETDLYYFVKDFFREYLLTNKEMSFEEVIQEIDKTYIPKSTKNQIVVFLKKISTIEYADDSFDEDELRKHIKEFSGLVKKMPEKEGSSNSLFSKIFKVFSKKKEAVSEEDKKVKDQGKQIEIELSDIEELPTQDEQLYEETELEKVDVDNSEEKSVDEKELELLFEEQTQDEPNDIIHESDVETLLKKAQSIQDKDKLLEIYNEVNEIYEQKDPEEKSKIYPELVALYEKLVSAKEETEAQEENNNFVLNELDDLLLKSENTQDKEELMNIYEKINSLYEEKSYEEKTSIYPKLMKLYEKIQKLP